MKARVMSHLVSHFPDREASLEIARALTDGGSAYLELQFPFSDPVADGPPIQEACSRALASGFSTAGGLRLAETIRSRLSVPLFVMCYANTVYFHGTEWFVKGCAEAGVRGLIVPDLPVDHDEGLFDACKAHRIHAVPVMSPSVSDDRLQILARRSSPYAYAALRPGITGAGTSIDGTSLHFLKRISLLSREIRVLAGFGISSARQVRALQGLVHAAVVGSAYVREILRTERSGLYAAVRRKAEELTLASGSAQGSAQGSDHREDS